MSDYTHIPMEYISIRHQKTTGNWKFEAEFPPQVFNLFLELLGPPPANGESVWIAVSKLEKPVG